MQPSTANHPLGGATHLGAPMYEISRYSQGHPRVEVWSSTRLPFEPKGEMQKLRAEIRRALAALAVPQGMTLQARYQSSSADRCDIENVLFYNVGTAYFSPSGLSRTVMRRFTSAPPAAPSGHTYSHFVSYEVAGRESLASNSAEWGSFETAPLPARGAFSDNNPWFAWRAFRRGSVTVRTRPNREARFGMRVVVEGPTRSLHPVRIMKPLLDGLIAGMACHDGSDMETLTPRVAQKAGINPAEARQLLLEEDRAILGRQRLVWAFRDGVQMNPPDERLDYADIVLSATDAPAIRIRGAIFPVV